MYNRGPYVISTEQDRLDIDVIHGYLHGSYWAAGIERETVVRAVEHSFCFGLYHGNEQVGFARVVTDFTGLAYLADVFVLEEHRRQGLGTWLVATIMAHPDLQSVRRWMLRTRDAHGLYARHGFRPLDEPETVMEYRP